MKKQLATSAIMNELAQGSAFFQASPQEKPIEQKVTQVFEQKAAQKIEQAFEQVSNPLSKDLSNDGIETLAFQLRKVRKMKVNAEIPEEWKVELDDLAHELNVGKYDLLTYLIGRVLGKVA